MKPLDDAITSQIFEASTYERRDVEFKPPFAWTDTTSNWAKEKVIRAVIGMSNTKGGGYVVIGVDETTDHKADLKGLDDTLLGSFEDYEAIKGAIDGFVYGYVDFQIGVAEYDNHKFAVIAVSEFEETPNLCKKNGQENGILVKDELYVRSKSSSPATIKATDLELREILKMAADKEKVELDARGFTKATEPNVVQYYKEINKDLE